MINGFDQSSERADGNGAMPSELKKQSDQPSSYGRINNWPVANRRSPVCSLNVENMGGIAMRMGYVAAAVLVGTLSLVGSGAALASPQAKKTDSNRGLDLNNV